MITGALDAGVPASWVAGDEVYGADPSSEPAWGPGASGRCWWWPCDHLVVAGGVTWRADGLLRWVPARAWQCISAGQGAKGHRYDDWAFVQLDPGARDPSDPGQRRLLVRRTARPGSWPSTLLDAPPHPAGRPGHGGRAHPDQQGPVWPGPASGPPLALLVPLDDPCLARHAFLVVAALADNTRHPWADQPDLQPAAAPVRRAARPSRR